jgi:aconitase A
MQLSAQHELFIEQFLELRNVREASIAAGYDPSYGYTLFKKLRTQIETRLQDEMIMMQAQALAVVKDSMTNDDMVPAVQAVKMRAAEQTMDRGSMTKKQNLEVSMKELPAVMILPPKNPLVSSKNIDEDSPNIDEVSRDS